MIPLSPQAWNAHVDAIINFKGSPVVRNLQITQCYHDLSIALTRLLGGENANWCTFATWASRTAGHFIRGEEFPARIRGMQGKSPYYTLREAILRRKRFFLQSDMGFYLTAPSGGIEQIVDDISGHVAAGNLKVFAELGPLFSSMIATFSKEQPYCLTWLEQFLKARLQPGTSKDGGQSRLSSAVQHFYKAMYTDSPALKAEFILYANAQVGLHEQIRLQPHIANALNAPLALARPDFSTGPHQVEPMLASRLPHPVRSGLANFVSKAWLNLATQHMELELPEGALNLGFDLPPPRVGPLYPPELQVIDYHELLNFLTPYKAHDNTPKNSGAANWADLYERMKFILELFRSRQQDQSLFEQPFTYDQRTAIAKGELPSGAL